MRALAGRALETALNHTLSLDPETAARLSALDGRSVAVGFLGAYTTFSTLSLQIYRSTATGQLGVAFANAFGSLAAGVLALYGGILLARTL